MDHERIEHVDIRDSPPSFAGSDEDLSEHYTRYPNRWSKYRYAFYVSSATNVYSPPDSEYIREPAAEFFGVMILIIFGAGVDCQVVLSSDTRVASSPKGVSASLSGNIL